MTEGAGDTKPQEPAGARGDVAAIQRRDLANGATGLDEIRCNPIKMHKVARFCRNKKRHEPRAGNGQYFFFFLQESCGGTMGHTQPAVVCHLRTMSYTATGTLSVWQASLCSAPQSGFGQHTFNKIQTFWKKTRRREARTTPSLENTIWEETGLSQSKENTAEEGRTRQS